MHSFLNTSKINVNAITERLRSGLVISTLLAANIAFAQVPGLPQNMPHGPGGMPMEPGMMPAPDPSELSGHIASIATKDTQTAGDFAQMAQLTIDFGLPLKQQGQLPDERMVYDAIEAVTVGEEMNPLAADWNNLRQQLYDLLEEPPQQDQQNQDQNQENDQENQDDQNSEDQSQDQQGENQDSENQNSDSQNQDQEGSEDQESQDQEQQGDQSSEQNQEGSEDGEPQPSQQNQSESLGDMETPEEPLESDQPQQAPQTQPETMGGAEQEDRSQDSQQAKAYQLLDKVKQQDQPSRFFRLLQSDEEGVPQDLPNEKKKDW